MKHKALHFIILIGIVSLFADMTYEGARSITGPYLAFLGATGAVVGCVAGIGEWIGYGFRLVSGYVSDKIGRHWPLTFLGYSLNVLAVPLLAFASNWQMAALCIILERFGKAIRAPAKDAMLSFATNETGRGRGFGIYTSLDQTGALLGPLFITYLLMQDTRLSSCFAWLVLPALCALGALVFARRAFPHPENLEPSALSI